MTRGPAAAARRSGGSRRGPCQEVSAGDLGLTVCCRTQVSRQKHRARFVRTPTAGVRGAAADTPHATPQRSALATFDGQSVAAVCAHLTVRLGFTARHRVVDAVGRLGFAAARRSGLGLDRNGRLPAQRDVDLRHCAVLGAQLARRCGALAQLLRGQWRWARLGGARRRRCWARRGRTGLRQGTRGQGQPCKHGGHGPAANAHAVNPATQLHLWTLREPLVAELKFMPTSCSRIAGLAGLTKW
jgi:hypothetical protein